MVFAVGRFWRASPGPACWRSCILNISAPRTPRGCGPPACCFSTG
jgi:hypothetical protein